MDFNPMEMLKNAQKMQERMGVFQERLAELTATGYAGAGMVEIDLNGKFEVVEVRISDEAAGDAQMLSSLIEAAFADAHEKVQALMTGELGAMAAGMGMAGFPGFPGST
ncbi:MAG: YbaB/EbfC family nucleoid-associated protein [Treponema sp.]|nr:YbaB/EbfC family nucleoid-associated protein [Treponema sp.]